MIPVVIMIWLLGYYVLYGNVPISFSHYNTAYTSNNSNNSNSNFFSFNKRLKANVEKNI